jgi:hypothetical protein
VNTPRDVDSLAEAIAQYLTEPHHFYDVMAYFPDIAQRQIVLAWGQLREQNRLDREQATGRYLLKNASSQES